MDFSPPELLSKQFVTALRGVPTAVAVITTWLEDRPWGLTVSAFSSVCADPPHVLACVSEHTQTVAGLLRDGRFGISFLSASQTGLAERSAAPRIPKFVDFDCGEEHDARGPLYGWTGGSLSSDAVYEYYGSSCCATTPMIHGAYCHLQCDVAELKPVGDHIVVLGQVLEVLAQPAEQAEPLVYFNRSFHALGASLGVRSPAPVTH
jgi:flavin reductase (DIM6/NTAB) family NADH-FMN oxidoreductase RutF